MKRTWFKGRQRDSLAKFSYDVSKIIVATLIFGNTLSKDFSLNAFLFGMIASLAFLKFGLALDEEKENG